MLFSSRIQMNSARFILNLEERKKRSSWIRDHPPILWIQSSEAFIHKSRASHHIGGLDSVSTGMMSYQIFCFLLFVH